MSAVCKHCQYFDNGGDMGPICHRPELVEEHRVWGNRPRSIYDPFTLDECDRQGYYKQKRPVVPQQRIFGGWL